MSSRIHKGRLLHDDIWRVGDQIDSGGNATIFDVTELSTEKHFILKKFSPQEHKEDKFARFKEEISLATNPKYKGYFVPILDYDISNIDESYFIMPVCDNWKGILKHDIVKKINGTIELLHKLVYLHSFNIAHRDIKPENILYYDGMYYFADLGLAIENERHTVTGSDEPIGSKSTRPPEMVSSPTTADPYKADVYCLAKTIWGILVGNRNCFPGMYSRESDLSWEHYDNVFSPLNRNSIHKDRNLTYEPLHVLMEQCTQNDSQKRPTAEWMRDQFMEWLNINSDFTKFAPTVWKEYIHNFFPRSVPEKCVWTNLADILEVLKSFSKYRNSNEILLPVGNCTMTDVGSEKGFLRFFDSGIKYLFPIQELKFYYASDRFCWFIMTSRKVTQLFSTEEDHFCFEELIETKDGNIIPYDDITPFNTRICRYYDGTMILAHRLFFPSKNELEERFRKENSDTILEMIKDSLSKE